MLTKNKSKLRPSARRTLYAAYRNRCAGRKSTPVPIEDFYSDEVLVASIHAKIADGRGYAEYLQRAPELGEPIMTRAEYDRCALSLADRLLVDA